MENNNSVYKRRGIYRITNKINGNTYIGKTVVNFGDRWDCHKSQLRGGYHDNKHLQAAWNKYGEDSFEFDIVEELDDVSNINDLEIVYIQKYRDAGKCYNISDGGDGGLLFGKQMPEETRRKIGEKNRINMLGKRASEETKEKMSASHKKRYESWTEENRKEWGRKTSEYASGYKWTDEQKEKFSQVQRTRPNGSKYDIDTIHKIRHLHEKENKSCSEIAEILGMNKRTVYNIATYRRWKYV